jgi:uncharacterized protein
MTDLNSPDIAQADLDAMQRQLGRQVRGAVEVSSRCKCGEPNVVKTLPRLPDGTPFPTTYYLTCPRLSSLLGTLEADGYMRELESLLETDDEIAAGYLRAHESYLADRAELGDVHEISGISAGGMPNRVKCLHVLVAHSLAKGPGVNPLGDLTLQKLGNWADSCNGTQV